MIESREERRMEHFCYNSECMMHKYEGGANVHSIEIENEDGSRRKIERHVYADRHNRYFFFCMICHTAIHQVIGRTLGSE